MGEGKQNCESVICGDIDKYTFHGAEGFAKRITLSERN